MKTLIIGDIHNVYGALALNKVIKKTKPDLILSCGDFGYWPRFSKETKAYSLPEIKLQTAKELRWCEGNHEDYWSLKQRISDEILPGIIYQPRGSTYTLPDGRVILFMGGASSIDKNQRILGINWFPDETITQKDLYNLPDINIDIFITHTAPTVLVNDVIPEHSNKTLEPSNHALSALWEIYKPDLWFFGHYHHYYYSNIKGTKYFCLSASLFYKEKWWMWLPDK